MIGILRKRTWISLGMSLGLVFCRGPSPDAPVDAQAPKPPADDAKLEILVYHDMEGLSGQDDWRTFEYRHRDYYPRGQELLVADVNAVIDGLFAGGADVVHVVDAHGGGNPEPDILLDKLDARASLVFRDKPFRPYVDLTEPGSYDAIAVVGMHAKTGSGGFASHTFTLGMDIVLNGMSITESEIIGYSWGRVGVPVIFGSGDDRLEEDLKTMPWIEYVTVKKATSASSAELRPVDEVRAEMREKARRAVENRHQAKVMTLQTPIEAKLRAVPPASLTVLEGVPGVDYQDNAVRFFAKDFQEAYDGVVELMGVATAGYARLWEETIAELPNRDEIQWEFEERLMNRWLDYESERWTPPPPPERPTGRRYHGAQ